MTSIDTWSVDRYPRAARDIRPGDTVASDNLFYPDGRPAIGTCAIAGECIRQGEPVALIHPYAWSVANS